VKTCLNCGRVVFNKVKVCPDCNCDRFAEILSSPYDCWDPYLDEEVKDNGEEVDKSGNF